MIDLPSGHAATAILVTGAMFYGFASGRLKIEIISLLTISLIALWLYFFPLPGKAPTDGLRLAFEGFGHYALITICALMIMGTGLVTTGALEPAARALTKIWRVSRQLGLLVTLLLAMGLSMMVNDTPVLVLLLPIMAALATRGGMPASKTLIPINAAVLIGGMATTIGTSTNLLVVSIATDLGLPPMGVFHFTPIVLMAALIALPYIWLVMPRLLPDNSPEAGHAPRRFLALLRYGGVEKTLATFKSDLPMGATFSKPWDHLLQAGERLEMRGTHDEIETSARTLRAAAAPRWLLDRLKADYSVSGEDLTVVELSVTVDSDLIGKTTETAGAANHHVAILGVYHARRAWKIPEEIGYLTPFAEGDILLVSGSFSNVQSLAKASNLLVLEGAKEMPRTLKAPLALAIMAGSVIPATLGLIPIAISALGGAILMFVTGCVKFEKVGRALSAKVIVLVAASIVVGKIVLESGAAEWLSKLLALGLQFLPPAGVLAAIMLFVTLLTNFASNTTAAAVGTPIAFSLAKQLGIPAEPLVLAVLFGCNLCYATPVAYQTNMLIMSAGDYQFKDYTRTGIPLVLLMVTSLSLLLVYFYKL